VVYKIIGRKWIFKKWMVAVKSFALVLDVEFIDPANNPQSMF
jgi:hypothetical protein